MAGVRLGAACAATAVGAGLVVRRCRGFGAAAAARARRGLAGGVLPGKPLTACWRTSISALQLVEQAVYLGLLARHRVRDGLTDLLEDFVHTEERNVKTGKAGSGREASDTSTDRFRRGNGGGTCGRGEWTQHGKPLPVAWHAQPPAREGQVGPFRVAERPVVPGKPGNAGGGKGPRRRARASVGRWQVASTAARSETPNGRACPRPRSEAVRPVPGEHPARPLAGGSGLPSQLPAEARRGDRHRGARRSPAGVVQFGEVGRQRRVVEFAPGEPSVQPSQRASVRPSCVRADGGLDQAGRGLCRPPDRGLFGIDSGE